MEIIVCVLFIAFVVVGVFLLIDAAKENREKNAANQKKAVKKKDPPWLVDNNLDIIHDNRVFKSLDD